MRGTLATALLLAASSQMAVESNQIDPRRLSHYDLKTPDKINTKSLFLRGRRKQPVDVAADETRTIENAMTSALHGITDPSGVADATRGAVREILDLNAFPEEVVRPHFDLNFPPSETSAHLSETSDIPQTKQASASTVSDTAVSSSHTSNQDTAKTQAISDIYHKPVIVESSSKTQLDKPVALERQKSSRHGKVEAVYKLYFEHLQKNPKKFVPTQEETEKMLELAQDSMCDTFFIASAYNTILKGVKGKNSELLKGKLGKNLLSTLSSLASLKLPPKIVEDLQRPFVSYASHVRWRIMYRDFFEFYTGHINKETDVPSGNFHGEKTNGAVNAQPSAKPSNGMDFSSITSRNYRLKRKVDLLVIKYGLEGQTAAAVKKACQVFEDKEVELSRSYYNTASHDQLGNQRTDLSPEDLQNPGLEKNIFLDTESTDHAGGKRPRSS